MVSNLSEADRAKYIHTAYSKSNQMKVLVEDLFEFFQDTGAWCRVELDDLSLSDLFAQLIASYEMKHKT